MAEKLCDYIDPYTNETYGIYKIPLNKLEYSPYQREVSQSLVDNLAISIAKRGFLSLPLVVKNGEKFYVVDGMHRIEALKQHVSDAEVICLVLPNEKEFLYSLVWNVEKASNIKEKSKQVYKMFMEEYNIDPEQEESKFRDLFEIPYYITCGIALEEVNSRFSPSAFENILKKVDFRFFDMPIKDTYKMRKKWAKLMDEVWQEVNKRFQDLNLRNYFLKSGILSKAFSEIYGQRVRSIDDDFETCMEKLKAKIPNVWIGE